MYWSKKAFGIFLVAQGEMRQRDHQGDPLFWPKTFKILISRSSAINIYGMNKNRAVLNVYFPLGVSTSRPLP